jgi:hypothetical protein
MPARFEKDTDTTFDGFDSAFFNLFQMVPVDGDRDIEVVTDTVVGCNLTVKDPLIADLAFLFPRQPFPLPQGSVTIPANSRAQIRIHANKVGATTLILDEGPGGSRSTMQISVKQQLQRTYSLLFLADRVNATHRVKAAAIQGMKVVETVFLDQANLKLSLFGAPTDVKMLDDLGNPLILTEDVISRIIRATPRSVSSGPPDNILIYSTWDVGTTPQDAAKTLGATESRFCFVEDDVSLFVFAHEVGHALRLEHNLNPTRLMFPIINPVTRKLDQVEIDQINPSGTVR